MDDQEILQQSLKKVVAIVRKETGVILDGWILIQVGEVFIENSL